MMKFSNAEANYNSTKHPQTLKSTSPMMLRDNAYIQNASHSRQKSRQLNKSPLNQISTQVITNVYGMPQTERNYDYLYMHSNNS